MPRRRRIGAVTGALIAIAAGLYHNAHVNVWTGGVILRPGGYLLLAAVGAVVGALIAGWIDRTP